MLRVVALRKESVDRNLNTFAEGGEVSIVALRKESVDRNVDTTTSCGAPVRSLSARRAWIEIFKLYLGGEQNKVALRKESVDRNFGPLALSGPRAQSLSARRAWIEIQCIRICRLLCRCRSPQGERG